MIPKLLVSIGIFFYAIAVPMLEINETHVFNPHWEPHARLHEVWQLFTNTAIGVFSLWIVWFKGNLRLSSLMTLFVTGGFLMSYWLRSSYGGSMIHSDGSEKMIFGINLGLFAYALAIFMAGAAVAIEQWAQRGKHADAAHGQEG